MLLASFMRDGWRVKLRLVPGDEKRFLAQLSADARGSSTPFFLSGHAVEVFSESRGRVKC